MLGPVMDIFGRIRFFAFHLSSLRTIRFAQSPAAPRKEKRGEEMTEGREKIKPITSGKYKNRHSARVVKQNCSRRKMDIGMRGGESRSGGNNNADGDRIIGMLDFWDLCRSNRHEYIRC
jgi:hypothetical protein